MVWQRGVSQMEISTMMSANGSDLSFSGPNGLANCNIFNNELTLECKCSPTSKEKSRRKKDMLREQSKAVPPTSPSVSRSKVLATSPSVSGSKYEIVRKPSASSKKKKKKNVPPEVDILHEPTSKYTLKPLKAAKPSKNHSPTVDTDEMARLYEKYLETEHETVVEPTEAIADYTSQPSTKPTKVALFFGSKYKKKSEEKKKECLNENILTKDVGIKATAASRGGRLKERSLKFLKAKPWAKPVHTEEFVVENKEGNVLEKTESVSSDPTVASDSNDSNSIVDTHPAPDEDTLDNTAMDVSVFEVFEQYTGGAFPTHHCSPRLSSAPKHFEFNKQAELLARIEELQNELSLSKGTVKDLTQELDEVYSGKDFAVHELDRLIEFAKMNENADEEHEKLREIRMYLTDRTEPTISSITTTRSYHAPSEVFHPFCSCFRSRE